MTARVRSLTMAAALPRNTISRMRNHCFEALVRVTSSNSWVRRDAGGALLPQSNVGPRRTLGASAEDCRVVRSPPPFRIPEFRLATRMPRLDCSFRVSKTPWLGEEKCRARAILLRPYGI